MEKFLNDEEKIRRAEEIYYRRNNQAYPVRKKEDKKIKNVKYKLLLNLLIMFNLAIIVFCIQNKEFIFTKEFIEKMDEYNSNATRKILNVFDSKNILFLVYFLRIHMFILKHNNIQIVFQSTCIRLF